MLSGPEFDFLLTCCLRGQKEFLGAAGPQTVDWQRLMGLASRHRVDGLLWQRLAMPDTRAPPEVLAALGRLHRAQSLAHLAQLRETLQLSRLLEEKGYPVIVLKGCVLAHELYAPTPGLRHSQDIDLLVSPQDFAGAPRVLEGEGYVRQVPNPDMRPSAESMALYLTNAFIYVQSKRGVKVELHHRLLHDPHVMQISFSELLSRSRSLEVGNGALRCLGPADLSVYLCCHAACHGFFRLKWLADIARLIECGDVDTMPAMLMHARELNCERYVLLTLLMLERLAGQTGSGPAIEDAHEERMIDWLATKSKAAILRKEPVTQFRFADIPDFARTAFYDFWLAIGWRPRVFHIFRYLCSLHDLTTFHLGVKWRVLYAFLGPPLALLRLLQRSIK